MEKPVFRNVFKFQSEIEHDGLTCEITGVYINPNQTDVVDAAAMPQIAIRFTDDNEDYSASPEEIAVEFWPQSIHDFFAGRIAFENNMTICPFAEPERKEAWGFGYQHAELVG